MNHFESLGIEEPLQIYNQSKNEEWQETLFQKSRKRYFIFVHKYFERRTSKQK